MLKKSASLIALSSLVATTATWAIITLVATPDVGAATASCPAPTAANSPCVKFATRKGPVDISATGQYVDVGSVFLEPGKWWIMARVDIGSNTESYQLTVPCQLRAGGEREKSWVTLPKGKLGEELLVGTPPLDRTATNVLTMLHNFKDGGDAIVVCVGAGDDVQARDVRITAMRVGTAVRLPAA